MFTIPDKGEGQNDLQSILFQEQIDILLDGLAGVNCVLSGGAVTAQGSPNMTVAVAKSAVLTAGVLKATAAWTGTITTADATNPRLDLVVVDSSGAGQVRAGTPAVNPKPPTRTANDVVLAIVYVPATDTTISSDQITDMRVLRTSGPVVVDKKVSATTFNATSAIQTYYSLVVPSGLMSAGKVLRVRCGGTMLLNSGSPTVTLTIVFGGTTFYAEASAAFTADTDRRVWVIELDLIALTTASQVIIANGDVGVLGAVTTPTTGSGMIAGGTALTARGSSTVDMNAADRTLEVKWTMSVSNAADEVSCEYATAELL